MSTLGLCICLVAIAFALCSVSAAIRYVGDQVKRLVDKKEISTINEIEETVDYLSKLSNDDNDDIISSVNDLLKE